VGGFVCRCGFLWTLKAETTYGSHLLPNEVVFEEYGEAPPRLLEYAAQQSQVLRCPNCRAVIVEDEDGIHLFVAATEPPRLYATARTATPSAGSGCRFPAPVPRRPISI
jgi:transposase